MPIDPDVLVPAVSGAAGALLGAGASVLGSVINARHEEKKRTEQRRDLVRDREAELERTVLSEAASTLSQSFSLLHEVRFIAETMAQPADDQLATVKQHWTGVRDKLFVLGVGYPEKETAQSAMELVGKFTEVMNWFERRSDGRADERDSGITDSLDLVIRLLNRVRDRGGHEPIFQEEREATPAEPAQGAPRPPDGDMPSRST